MLLFLRLLLAHVIADFSLQTNYIAHWKRDSVWGLLAHVAAHPVASVILAWPYLPTIWIRTRTVNLNGWTALALIVLFHALTDAWRIWAIKKGTPDDTAFFLWDQLAHIAIILACVPTFANARLETWVLVALCAALLAHFASVLIYFLEKDLLGTSEVLGQKKYYYIAERVIGAGLFLLPGAWFLLALGWMGRIFYLHYRQSQERSWVHLVVGNSAVALLGLITRGLLS